MAKYDLDTVTDVATWRASAGPGLIERVRGSFALRLGLACAVMFLVMLTWELINADEPFTVAYVIEEVVDMALLVGFASAVAFAVLGRVGRQASELAGLRADLDAARVQGDAWRERMRGPMADLAEAVRRQFADWNLSDAEQDIAFLLLKGLSLKEIATIRETHENTVRQQAAAIYRKAGLEGRSALAAFFFEDMLAPPARVNGGKGAR